MLMNKAKFITVEGIEGAGKSTVVSFIADYLRDQEKPFITTREPGGTVLGEHIRDMLLHSNEKIAPQTELLLIYAARAQHIVEYIAPALAAGQWVISDRFVDASHAYQGGGRLIADSTLEALDHIVVEGHMPDLTFLLDVSIEVSEERSRKRGQPKDRIEQEHRDFFNRVRLAYLTRAEQYPERIKIINANLGLEDVEQQLFACLNDFFKQQVGV